MQASIYFVDLPKPGFRLQFGYDVLGTYSSLKGARIAAKKLGYTYLKPRKVKG